MTTHVTKTWIQDGKLITEIFEEKEIYKREWVGLTDEETLLIFATCHEGWAYPQDAKSGPRAMRLTEGRAIEAKLKEKNT